MSTCPACHQPIPQTCKKCGEQIIFREGKPVSWQNHFKVCGAKVKKARVSFGKPPAATEAEQRSFDAAVEKATKNVTSANS